MAYQSLTEMITFDPENIERVVECAKTILTTNERAKAIVQQLVSWTHHGSQETMPLNLSQTIRSARPLMRALIPSNVELQVRVAQHDLFVEASPESVTQILLNLIGNAEFAMRERGGKLAVVVESTEMKTDNGKVIPGLSLHVRDDGCGIPADLQHQVCTPFFTTKTGEGHSGMGLATVYETVRALNGRLEITSKENQGTNIQIQLPVLDGLSTHSVASEGDRHNQCTDARILLVDDDAVIANSMTEQLRMYGYVVECQTNSSAALERFNANPNGYDLLLTDLTMPGMCGDELMRAVREVRSELPVVLLTGFNYSAKGEASEVVSLRKPIAISDLVEKIEFALTSNAFAAE